MKSADRARCSMRRRRRIYLPVPLDRIPTVHPARKAGKSSQPQGRLWSLFKRMWSRLPKQFASAPHDPCGWRCGGVHPQVNPATGLPMVGGVDTAGNPYGCASHRPFDSDANRTERHTSYKGVLHDIPPFDADWHESRVTLDSIERRWDPGHDF